jgi:predicted permease
MKPLRQIRAWLLRFGGLFRKHRRDRELAEEFESNLQLHVEDNLRRGMTPAEARRQALLKFGGIESAKESYRDRRGVPFLDHLLQDIRFGLRQLRRSPGFTTVAVLTLALGIGANTAIFSLIDALLLRSLPVRNPQELVMLKWSAHKKPNFHSYMGSGDCQGGLQSGNPGGCSFSHPFFNDLSAQDSMFASVAASGGDIQLDLTGNGPASLIQGLVVSGNYFDTLGVRPAFGRVIEPSDEEPSAQPVMVLGNGYWQRVFGGSPSVIGKTFNLNGVATTIVGVAEPRFVGLTPGSVPDAWVPLSLNPRLSPGWNPREDDAGSAWILIIARLNPDVPREKAEASANLLFRNEMLHGAQPFSKESDKPSITLVSAQTGLIGARGKYSTPLFILMLAVGIVLLIACANVAGLLLARSAARQKEMNLRLALGASRWRIIRQLLTESILLSVCGGSLGILLAIWGAHSIVAFVASGSTQPLGFDTSIDLRVLLFTAGISLLTGILFGLAPAMRGTRVDLTPALKEGAGSSAGAARSGNRWLNIGNSLVIGQVALTMVVLVGAGLLVRTLQNLRNIDPGFDAGNILNFRVNPTLIGYKGTQVDALYRNLQSRLNAIPGVTSVSFSNAALLSGRWGSTSFHFPDAPDKSAVRSDILWVGPDFFKTLKISFLEGRDFSSGEFVSVSTSAAASTPAPIPSVNSDARSSVPKPVIVNQTFVRRYFGSVDPLGHRFADSDGRPNDPGYVVVGVVHDAKYKGLRDDINPTTYVPVAGRGVNFELRMAVNPASIIPAVRIIVNQVDGNLPIFDVITESESIDQLLFQERLIARLSSLFGLLAIILACVGLYGLLSYDVTRRTREIGIRMALGAQSRNVLLIVILQGIVLAAIGVAIGVGAAFGVTRYLGSILYEVHPGDPITQISVGLLLLAVAFVACFIPAIRATRVDPIVALRNE